MLGPWAPVVVSTIPGSYGERSRGGACVIVTLGVGQSRSGLSQAYTAVRNRDFTVGSPPMREGLGMGLARRTRYIDDGWCEIYSHDAVKRLIKRQEKYI